MGFRGEPRGNLPGRRFEHGEGRPRRPGDTGREAGKRAEFRLHHVGTKLNERELRELEGLLGKRGQTQGEFIRGLILAAIKAEIERDRGGVRPSVELVEIAALRLQIMNLLKPVLAGKPMSTETFDAIMRETKSHKRSIALEVLRDYHEKDGQEKGE